jgi:hypothetical protein
MSSTARPIRDKTLLHRVTVWGLCLFACTATVSAQDGGDSIGGKMVAYLTAHLNERVAGGSAWHMASEALRIAGGEFVPGELGQDAPYDGDRVWGTLVKVISNSGTLQDSAPQTAVQPGDVIQFHSATVGTTTYSHHFTAVVAEVNADGQPTSIFSQNRNSVRKVQKSDFDVTALTSGWMRIYRPKARVDRPDEWKFSVVNNNPGPQTYDLMVGIEVETSASLSDANSYGSYRVHWVKTDGTVPNLLRLSVGSYFMETGKGYEIPTSTDENGFRQLDE